MGTPANSILDQLSRVIDVDVQQVHLPAPLLSPRRLRRSGGSAVLGSDHLNMLVHQLPGFLALLHLMSFAPLIASLQQTSAAVAAYACPPAPISKQW